MQTETTPRRDAGRRRALVALLLLCTTATSMRGYSVLTHEQVIDLSWQDHIQPLLLKRFPQSTPDDLKHAHAFAYGGSLVQDMGYYPFGKKFFSDLLQMSRPGHRDHYLAVSLRCFGVIRGVKPGEKELHIEP